ncbi:MAG: HAMP domain-containing protein [Betaproteobacteria bacterium]|nr:HAMP domain-containing protein [Betaproteobacteria bacterium]
MKRLLPQSLFGRLMLVLASGLIVAQLLSAAINLSERDTTLVRVMGMQPAQRIADIVRMLDVSSPAERARIVGILNVPPLVVSLDRPPLPEDAASSGGAHAAMFAAVLRAALGDDRPMRVAMTTTPPSWALRPGRMEGRFAMNGPSGPGGMHPFSPGEFSMLTQVRLQDGTWASFDTRISPSTAGLPWRLLLALAFLLAAMLLLSWVAVRWVTRPLDVLATAADQLGRDIHRPPLPEDGPLEVGRAARAFNTMQARLIRFVDERTRLLTAMSHDLKTPLTRMRLRTELLEDAELRDRYEKDLVEMEAMVTQTLESMRGLANREPPQPVDVMALLESLRSDNEAMGRTVTIDGRATRPLMAEPQLLKRCISNLIDNAVIYGGRAQIHVDEDPSGSTIRVRDLGPGIPDSELERVFEPFVRLEGSRSRETGGTGLGLSIARSIARAHGGDVRLRNHEDGGLEATVSFPRRGASGD